MNAIGAAILVVLVLVILCGKRQTALLGMLAAVLYLTQGQQVQIVGFNLYAVRFIELAGFIRILSRKEFSFSNRNKIDNTLLFFLAFTTIVYLCRSKDGQAYQIGLAVDGFLCYFIFRGLIQEAADLRWFLKAFTVLLAPYVVLVLMESFTQHNPFASMGGVEYGNWLRGGRPRCQGSFRHPSLLGTLGATFIPLYIGLAFDRADRKLAIFGIGLCLAIVWACNSGGPMNTAAIGVVGWMFWILRTRMKLVRRGLVVLVVILGLTMNAPIWYLPAKASSLTGGDGWHRSYLMDIAFQNIDRWWLAGMRIQDTAEWFPYGIEATGGADITNQFILNGITAGVFAIILFVALLTLVFKKLGEAQKLVRQSGVDYENSERLLWALGVVVVGHIFNWLGITYFDQTFVIWYMQLAAISSICYHSIALPSAETYEGIDLPMHEATDSSISEASAT